MSNTKSVLQMNFTTRDGKNFALNLIDPREDLTSEEVQEAMEHLLEVNFFDRIVDGRIKNARTVQTTTTDFDIIVVEE